MILAALTTAAIVALYVLKVGRRRVLVSSSLVWRRVLDGHASHRRERLRTIVSAIMAVAIALAILLSIGRPEMFAPSGNGRRIVIVLDTSPSMNARTSDGMTRWQHAVIRARTVLDRAGAHDEYRIADTSGLTTFAFTPDRREARAQIDKLSPQPVVPRFPNVDRRDSAYFVSDGVGVRDFPPFVQPVSVFELANNIGITAFDIRPVPSSPLEYEAYVEVANFGDAASVDLTIKDSQGHTLQRSARLAAQQTFREAFDLTDFDGGTVEAHIAADGDSLQADDAAYAYLPVRRRIRTLLVTRGRSDLLTLLKLDRHVDLTTVDPAGYRDRSDVDVLIFDRFAPSAAPSRPAFVIGTPAAPWLPQAKGPVVKPELAIRSASHPIIHSVPLQDVSVNLAQRVDAGRFDVIAASKDAPLILASEQPRLALLTFELGSSDLSKQAAFPVFIENVLAWLNGDAPAFRERPGMLRLPLQHAQLTAPDGRGMSPDAIVAAPQVRASIARVAAPGVYTASDGASELHLAVNFFSADLSNVNRSAFTSGPAAGEERNAPRRPLWFYMIVGAIVLLSVEWFTYHRRMTV